MPSEQDLLAAIDANSNEDAPRLAHADWLETNGDPEHAHFIRQQLAGDRADGSRWTDGLPRVEGMAWECVHGYPEKVAFRSYAAFKEGWPLTAGHRVRHVEFACLRGTGQFASDPALESIESLELSFLPGKAILGLLASPHLKKLRQLAVAPPNAPASFLGQFLGMPVLAGLRSLAFNTASDRPLRAEDLALFTGSPHLTDLRELVLQAWLDSGALQVLWQAGSLRSLTALDLSRSYCSSQYSVQGGLEDLGDGGGMPGLQQFRWGYEGAEGVGEALARASAWRLRRLDLNEAKVGDTGAIALAGAVHLVGLEWLMLDHCHISDEGAAALASSPSLHSLEFLSLRNNLIGMAGVTALGQSTSLPRLRILRLEDNPSPQHLIQQVEERFRTGDPPVAPSAPTPLPAVALPSAPVVGDADEDGLVRAIWADPFNESARAVYADWLDDQGSPDHAALLREVGPIQQRTFERIEARMKEDAPTSFSAWLTEDDLIAAAIPVRSLRSKAFEKDGQSWMRRHHVAEVRPEGTPRDWSALFSTAWLSSTRGLTFASRYFDALQQLGASSGVEGLASLTLGGNRHANGVVELCRGPGLRSLCRLVLPDDWLSLDCLRALAEAPFAGHLRHLVLGRTVGGLEGVAVLASAPALRGLVTLNLSRAYLGDRDIKMLAEAPGLDEMRNLDVSRGGFADVGLDALVGSPLLARLRRLCLSSSSGSPEALERLVKAVVRTPRCRLAILQDARSGLTKVVRKTLAGILGERLIVE